MSTVESKIEIFFADYPLKDYSKGQTIIMAGDSPPGILYVIKGSVGQYDISYSGNKVMVNIFKTPAFFPMNWAINNTPNQYFYEALSATQVRMAPPKEVTVFLKKNPDILYDLLSRVYRGADGLLRRMAHIMGGSARTRLLFELIVECQRFGKHEVGETYLLELKESELAARAGLTRETVNRELQKMKETNLLQVTRKGIIINNLEVLQRTLGRGL